MGAFSPKGHIPALLLAACLAAPLSAEPTAPGDLRELIYADDMEAVDHAFARLDAAARADDGEWRTVRDAFGIFSTTDRRIDAFSRKWLLKEPDSPYARIARAWLLGHFAKIVRGGDFAGRTAEENLSRSEDIWRRVHAFAAPVAEADPGFAPAMDIMLREAFYSRSDAELLKLLDRALEARPDPRYVGLASFRFLSQWGATRASAGSFCVNYASVGALGTPRDCMALIDFHSSRPIFDKEESLRIIRGSPPDRFLDEKFRLAMDGKDYQTAARMVLDGRVNAPLYDRAFLARGFHRPDILEEERDRRLALDPYNPSVLIYALYQSDPIGRYIGEHGEYPPKGAIVRSEQDRRDDETLKTALTLFPRSPLLWRLEARRLQTIPIDMSDIGEVRKANRVAFEIAEKVLHLSPGDPEALYGAAHQAAVSLQYVTDSEEVCRYAGAIRDFMEGCTVLGAVVTGCSDYWIQSGQFRALLDAPRVKAACGTE